MVKRLLLALFAFSSISYAEQVAINQFRGINNNEPAVVIEPEYAQDALNIDVTPGGKSVKKRSGYGLYKALATGQALHGGLHFFDSTGNDVQVWGSSTSLYGIVSDATPTQLISSATLNTTWDCADTQGNAYCVNSSRNMYLRTDGATKTWYTSPLGTGIEATPDRMVVFGVSGTPSTLYFSQSGGFTNYTTGVNETDAFTEAIASPGSKITHVRWGCGKLLWWKDQSFGFLTGDNQFNIENTIVSDNVGTFDNSSAIDPGGNVWFRGQDGHIWQYDCSGLQKMTVPITPNVQASGKRSTNSWSQTTQADFQAGAIVPTGNLSTTISAGAVISSSFTGTDTASADFALGAPSNVTIQSGSILVSTDTTGIANNSFESSLSTNWTETDPSSAINQLGGYSGRTCNFLPKDQSNMMGIAGGLTLTAELIDANSGSSLSSTSVPYANADCAWTERTIDATSLTRKSVKIRFRMGANSITSDAFISNGNSVHFFSSSDCQTGACVNPTTNIDFITNTPKSTITSGTFRSRTFDTNQTVSYLRANVSWTTDDDRPYFEVQDAASSGGPWSKVTSSTGTVVSVRRYVRYISSFTVTGTNDALSSIDDVSIVTASSGTFYSAVKNAPNLTGWDIFSVSKQDNGGSQAFYMRSSSNPFTIQSSTPSWISQTPGGVISVSTWTYFQVRDDFSVTSATDSPTLNDFTVNWFEGSASDQAYSIYFDNAIWWSVAFGSGQTVNNYIFKYDLINEGWTLYNFGAGGLLVQNNRLYFGDVSSGNIFRFGTGTSDNGSAIQAYWKTKDFGGSDPWLQNQYKTLDTYFTKNANQSGTVTYTVDTSSAVSYNVSLSSTTSSFIRNMKLLPTGKLGSLFNVKVGDTADSSQWELLGIRFTFDPLPYKAIP